MTESGQNDTATLSAALRLMDIDDVKKRSIRLAVESHDEFEEVIQFTANKNTQLDKVSSEEIKNARLSEVQSDMILSQSISIVLFYTDNQPQAPDIDKHRQVLGKYPWRFHHVTELNTKSQKSHRVHTRQEFHELARDLPLFSIGSVHYGCKILRFNIFTRRHQAMVDFYRQIFKSDPERTRADFYLFRLQQTNDVEVQLALKSTSKIIPYPTDKVQLVFKVKDTASNLKTESLTEGHVCMRDPDSNLVMLELQDSQQNKVTTAKLPTAVSDKEEITLKICQSESKSATDLFEKDRVKYTDEPEHTETQRPDVIPPDDILIKYKQSAGPTLIRLGSRTRAKSPCPISRKLNFTTQAVDMNFDGIGQLRKSMSASKLDPIDIVATF